MIYDLPGYSINLHHILPAVLLRLSRLVPPLKLLRHAVGADANEIKAGSL